MFSFAKNLFLICALFGTAGSLLADTKPFVHPLFSNDMVLQRDASDPVWGWTNAGATVTVTINGQTNSATADGNGRWQVQVGPFAAGGPYTMQVTGPQTATFTNILFGDVFLCSGQSNMEIGVSYVYNSSAEVADSVNYPNIRCFTVPKDPSFTPQDTISSSVWKIPGSSTTGNFSATAYFMAREIYKQQGVPIGVLVSSWGGTQIQSWVDLSVSSSVADFTQTIYDQVTGTPSPDSISGLYNGLISPLAPFRVRAAVWYQGEFNSGRGQQYSRLLPGLVSGWRTLFGQPNLPFLIVQLPNVDTAQTQPVETGGWAEIREAQAKYVTSDSTRTRLLTTLDIGEGNLHPKNKQDLGQRASWAMADLVYGQSVVSQGPVFTGLSVTGNTMQCTFSNVGAGLMVGTKNPTTPLSPVQQVSGGTLSGFSIAGADHVFYFANATITGTNTVSVSSPSVSTPVYIRYGWANNPVCNLYNKITDGGGTVVNGLPAGSFRNDPVYKLNVNAGGGGQESYTFGTTSTVSASVPSGQTFHHWGGDTGSLTGNTSSTTANMNQIYVSLRAYFQITSAPTASATAQVGQNVLEWNAMTSVHYNVKRSTASNGSFATIAGNLLGTTRYVDTNISDGVTYYYKISAINEVGEGPDTPAMAVTAIPYVHGLTATAGDAQVALNWSAFSGSALSYNINRSTTSGGPYQTITRGVAGTTFTDRSVIGGQTYYYVVSATTSGGDTPVSPEASAKPNFLPPPLHSQDIGSVGLPGSATMAATGALTVKASGADISGGADAFHYAYVPITGDCTISTHISSLENTNVFAKGGVMLRATLSADSPYAFAFYYGSQTSVGNQYRATAGANQTSSGSGGANSWLRVVRSGNSFTTYYSSNGTSWTQMGTVQTIVMPATIYAGLALTSHDNTKINTTVFDTITGLGLQAPQAPTSLTASLRANDAKVVLRWNAAPGALSYTVKRATSSGGSYTTIASGLNAVRYVPTGLTAGQKYYFVVSAVTGTGTSGDSNQASVAIPVVTMASPVPTELNAVAGDSQVTLSWSGSSLASNFNVKRATSSGGSYTTVASPTTDTYTDTGLTNGTTYYYVISATVAGNQSANSAQIAVAPRYPATTGAIKASINSRYVSAVGTAALIANQDLISSTELFDLVDVGSGLTAIRSLASGKYVSVQNPGNNQLYAINTTIGTTEKFTFTFTNGSLNMKASVNSLFVAAESAGSQPLVANRGGAGSYETFTFVNAAVPKSPENITATPGDHAVTLQWAAPAAATSYLIKRATASGGSYAQVGTSTTPFFTDTTATNGVAYFYVVSAVNGALASANSSEASATPQVQVPDGPTDLSATAVSESQLLLAWTNNATTATAYTVQRSPHSAASWTTLTSALAAGSTTYLDANLTASTEYDYRVQCSNSAGPSAFATASGSTPAGIGDGIPGSWRYQYFGNGLTLIPASQPGADPDGDGLTNAQEYTAGTIPTDGSSTFVISQLAISGNNVTISFPSVSGKSYRVDKTASLGNPSVWQTVQDNIAGTGSTITITDVGGFANPARFYHVVLK